MRNRSLAPVVALVLALLTGCDLPPPDSYVSSTTTGAGATPLGQDSSGAVCVEQTQGSAEILVYCGNVTQPSARVVAEAVSGAPEALADTSAWRTAIDGRFRCDAPATATLFGAPAVALQCVRRIGGWPHLALVAELGGKTYFGDADPSAAAVLQRAIGVLSGQVKADSAATMPIDPGLAATRAANQAISSRDIHAYDELMAAGVRANLIDDFAAAEAAFRQAAALQRADNPARADPLIHQALQLSNLGRYAEANAVFDRAQTAIEQARTAGGGQLADPSLAPRLALYRALSQLNQGRPTDALPLLDQAEQGYTAIVPPDQRVVRGPVKVARTSGLEATMAALAEEHVFQEPTVAAAILGLITTKRARAVAFLLLGRLDDSAAQSQEAAALAAQHGLAQAVLEARILRTSAMIDAARGEQGQSLALLTRATAAFSQIFPDSRPLAVTQLLRAASLLDQGRVSDGEAACRSAIDVLRRLKGEGITTALMMPCLDLFAASGAAAKAESVAQDDYAEMFVAAQLAQSGVTSVQIAQAAARLAESQRDSRVGEAIRRREQATTALDRLYRTRDALDARRRAGEPASNDEATALNAAIAKAEAEESDAEGALQTASPNYGQLVQEVVSAKDVLDRLHPGEALAAIVLGGDHGWTLVLDGDRIAVSHIDGGTPRVQALVTRIRASMQPGQDGLPPPFDAAASQELYAATLGGAAASLRKTRALVVAPSGPLLSIPFGLLLTGPMGDNPAKAPWLAREMTVAHVPAPANFVSLRKVAGGSRATRPWIGFGDPRPVTLQQAFASFPAANCADSARLLAALPRLEGARDELELVRQQLGGAAEDEILGDRFTEAAIRKASLSNYRVVEFATHGLLPTDLACQNEAAIMTSPAAGAQDASTALLTASRIAGLTLDADTVILSACNTSGPDGRTSGESLSGLARSFFYAGARSLLVTHWSVNDRVTTILVAGTMQRYQQDPSAGLAAALAEQQRSLLDQATGPLSALAHPFYWAPLALIGDGGGRAPAAGSRAAAAGL
jgi:CHAT domain-containing protein